MNMDPPPIKLDRPYHLLGAQTAPARESGPDLRLLAVLALFRARRVSSGRAAEIVGCSKVEFIDELDRHGLAYFTETPDELAAQVEAVRAVIGKQT
jgi:predicted HTH domain antitoxin